MKIITSVATQSAAADITTPAIDLGDVKEFSAHAVFSGSDLAGALIVQYSNDESNWVQESSTAVTSAADKMLEKTMFARFVRFFWDYTSGTGNLTLTVKLRENAVKGA